MRGPEGKIQDAVIKYAREYHGCLVKKNEVGRYFVQSGWPDYSFFPGKGLTFFHEYKRMGGQLTPLQAQVHKQLREAGYSVELIDSVEKGKASIDAQYKDPTYTGPVRDHRRKR